MAVNNCVGRRNLRSFVLLLNVSVVAGITSSLCSALTLFLNPLVPEEAAQQSKWLTQDRVFILASIATFALMNLFMIKPRLFKEIRSYLIILTGLATLVLVEWNAANFWDGSNRFVLFASF